MDSAPLAVYAERDIFSTRGHRGLLPISRSALRKWVAAGHWPAPLRIGGRILWTAAGVRDGLARLEALQARAGG